MKKLSIIFILSLLILSLTFNVIKSQEKITSSSILNPENIEEETLKLNEKWEYLGEEWKSILLEEPIIKGIDSFFQKINTVFVVLFAEPYSLSLKLFLIIALWSIFFFIFHRIFKYYTSFSKPIPLGISLTLVVIMSHLKLFEKQVNFLMTLFFGDKPLWMKLILGIIIILVLVILFALIKKFGKQIAESRRKMKEEEERLKIETGAKAGEALTKAVSEISEGKEREGWRFGR